MSETPQNPPPPRRPGIIAPYTVYILYILSPFVVLTAIVGVIIAYTGRRSAPAWLSTHYRFQIGTFWIGLLLFAVMLLALPFRGVGSLVALAFIAWLLIRCGYGLRRLGRREPIPVPDTWGFGWQRNR